MKKKLLKPIILAEVYLLLTLFLYEFGVWDYQTNNPVLFYLLIITYHTSLFVGYFYGCRIKIKQGRTYNFLRIDYIRFFLIANIFMVLLNTIRMGGINSFNIVTIVQQIISSLSDITSGYSEKMSVTQSNVFGGSIGTLILTLWSPVSYAIIPMGFFYLKKMKKTDRILFYTNIIATISGAVIIGTTKRIIDVFLAAVLYLLLSPHGNARIVEAWKNNRIKQPKKRRRTLEIVVIILVLMFIANYFVGSRGIGTYWNASFYDLGGIVHVNQNSILLKIFPSFLHSFLAILCSYFSQGYFGFSLSTSVSGVGPHIGNFSLWIVDKFDLNYQTYQYKIEQISGWDSRVQWCSAYSWIANDVGLLGVILVMFLMGLFFSLLYKEYMKKQSLVTYVLFYYMVITIMFCC